MVRLILFVNLMNFFLSKKEITLSFFVGDDSDRKYYRKIRFVNFQYNFPTQPRIIRMVMY